MHDRKCLLAELLIHFREGNSAFTWDDSVFLRSCLVRLEKHDPAGWSDFEQRLVDDPQFLSTSLNHLRGRLLGDWPAPDHFDAVRKLVDQLPSGPASVETDEAFTMRPTRPRTAVMYIEEKFGARGEGRIGRVSFSNSQRTLYYAGRRFQSMKGQGWLANYYDLETREWFWISRCRKDGQDALYPGIVEIDDDVRHEYWTDIRNRPELAHRTSFRSEGKYSRRKPR